MDSMRQLEVEAMVQDVLNEDFNKATSLNVEGVTKQGDKDSGKYKNIDVSQYIKKIIAEAMIGPVGPMNPLDMEGQLDPKYKKTRFLLQTLSDINWKLISASCQMSDIDPEIISVLDQGSVATFNFILKKLTELWAPSQNQTAQPVPQQIQVQTKETEIDSTNIQIIPKETITSPQNIQYSVESVHGDKVYLKDIHEGTTHTADINIVKKWKNKK